MTDVEPHLTYMLAFAYIFSAIRALRDLHGLSKQRAQNITLKTPFLFYMTKTVDVGSGAFGTYSSIIRAQGPY